MSAFLLLKWVHIISSVALVGIGFGSAYYFYYVNRRGNLGAISEVARLVVRADYWFTTPAVLVQPASGIALVMLGGYSFTESWLLATYALFVLAGICWLPVVWLQIRMAAMARDALEQNGILPMQYDSYLRYWIMLGMIAFPAMLAVFALMVFKSVEVI